MQSLQVHMWFYQIFNTSYNIIHVHDYNYRCAEWHYTCIWLQLQDQLQDTCACTYIIICMWKPDTSHMDHVYILHVLHVHTRMQVCFIINIMHKMCTFVKMCAHCEERAAEATLLVVYIETSSLWSVGLVLHFQPYYIDVYNIFARKLMFFIHVHVCEYWLMIHFETLGYIMMCDHWLSNNYCTWKWMTGFQRCW